MPNKAIKEYPPEVLRTRVLHKVEELPNGCWEWQGAVRAGYPAMEVGKGAQKRQIYAHRLIWVLYVGPLPRNARVGHVCGDPLCVNPEHLRIYRGGARSRIGGPHGEDHWQAKLTAAQVKAIRKRRKKTGETYEKLGDAYGVSRDCISKICRWQTWKHVR